MEKEEKIFSPYRETDIEVNKSSQLHYLWNKFKISSWTYLAHHPTCSRYRNHIFKIGSMYLCVGCTSSIIGFIIYSIVFYSFMEFFKTNPINNGYVTIFGVLLALIQLMLNPQNKWIKAFMRFSLGLGLGGYVALVVLVPSWNLKISLFVMLFFASILYNDIRKNKNTILCKNCSLRKADPPCNPHRNTEMKLEKLKDIKNKEKEKKKKNVKKVRTS